MKRVGGLWERLTSFSNLLGAAEAAAAGKRRRPDVAGFLLELEPQILRLRRELLEGSYQPGRYHTFQITDPKPRQISAAPFRDRVLHHALTRILEPEFEKRFSPFSFACRKGLGVHKALGVAAHGARHFPYVLKCDIRKYFASIDHEILQAKLSRVIKCPPTLQLAAAIIAGSNPQEECNHYFPGDDLFTPFQRRRGLPLGNQTSQFFANVYLDALDQLVTRRLRPGAYARYVDDFVVFSESKPQLQEMLSVLAEHLALHRLRLHAGKSRVYRCSEGLTFLGWRIFPTHTRLAASGVRRFSRRMRELQRGFAQGRIAWTSVHQSVQAWAGHAAHGDTKVLRGCLLEQFVFVHGTPSNAAGGFLPQ